MSLRLGIVGAGTMGARTGARVASREIVDFQLAGVADLDPATAAATASALGTEAFTSIEGLIGGAQPDALYIATPDHLHLEPCRIAASHGLPFLVEKPLATTVADAQAIVAEAAGIAAEVNFSNRWNPPFVAAKDQIESGAVGAFATLFARLNNTIVSPTRNLAWSAQTTSGWFLLSHCLDLAFWLHGQQARSVYAAGTRGILAARGIDTWDSIHAIVRYQDGGTGSFESVWVLPSGQPAPVEFTFRLVGDAGALTVDTSRQYIEFTDTQRTTWPGTLNWTAERFRAFAQTVRGQAAAAVPLSDGLENTRILVALHRSLETGAVEPVE